MSARDPTLWEESMNQVLFNFFSEKHKSYFMGGERLNLCPMTYCNTPGFICAAITYFTCCCWTCLGCLYCAAGGHYKITDGACGLTVCCPRQRWWFDTVASRSYLDLKTPEKIRIVAQNQITSQIKASSNTSQSFNMTATNQSGVNQSGVNQSGVVNINHSFTQPGMSASSPTFEGNVEELIIQLK